MPIPAPSSLSTLRLAVIGGGISGLAAAHRLTQLAPGATVQLFEAGPRLGGALDTRHDGELVLEQGADSFLMRDPAALDLCRELGLRDELMPTSTQHRRALVVRRRRLVPVPEGFVLMQPRQLGSVLRSPVLSLRGKLRLLAEPLVRKATTSAKGHDESVASFATRRLGREAFERLVEPLIGGIYVANADELSLAATFPEFLQAEREHGSLRAAWRAKSQTTEKGEGGAHYGAFMTLRGGLGRLIDALAAKLSQDCVRPSQAVKRITKTEGKTWRVEFNSGADEAFDGVIVAAPAARAATMVDRLDAELGGLLSRIKAASSVVVTLAYGADRIERPLDGFGFVAPRIEHRPILAASFPSVKFADRGPADIVPVRVFLGGALHPEMVDRDDDDLIAIARGELEDLIGARDEPRLSMVARWREAMPQYAVGHLDLVDAIERRTEVHRGLELAGNSYRGVGIPQCVRSGREAAERIVRRGSSPTGNG